jgi:hypothetical protein
MQQELPIVLNEDEYLLKIRPKEYNCNGIPTGFITKYNKDGSMPKSFIEWGQMYGKPIELPTTLHIESFKSGWEIVSWRFGMSQNWATMKHPDGFTLEIYLDNLLDIVKSSTIENGVLIGEYKWENRKLIKNGN